MSELAGVSAFVQVTNLKVHYASSGGFLGRKRHVVRAVDGVTFAVKKGTTLGLVGESGSGKSTVGRAITRLVPLTGGSIVYDGVDLAGLSDRDFFPYRKRIQMIFQDPYNALDPRMTVGDVIGEPLEIHFPELKKSERRERVGTFLEKVGLPAAAANRYPHQFSGGQRQRINIARSLILEPEFVICDESVSALDVSVQAQIVNLLQDLQAELGLTYLFIAHDLAIVRHISDEVMVMNQGLCEEIADADVIYGDPQAAYTRRLIDAVPTMPILTAARKSREAEA